MRFIKLSVSTRSPLALFDYDKGGKSFWNDLCGLLRRSFPDIVVEKKGAFQYCFFMPFSANDGEAVAKVKEMISSLNIEIDNFIVSSCAISQADLENLKRTDVDHVTNRGWFPQAEAALKSGAAASAGDPLFPPILGDIRKTTGSADPASPDFSGIRKTTDSDSLFPPAFGSIQKTAGSDGTPPPPPQEPKAEKKQMPASGEGQDADNPTLEGEAKRLSTLRDTLLSVVHGQRHAVDEVVQTVFECDAFNKYNEKHRGPLATFLFTGPSGVGKTFLARQCAEALGIEPLIVDMSEYSDNLANMKFNGEHGQPAIVTGYVRNHPKGIIIFDEIEKAHINTIYLFLQILDSGVLMDMKLNKEVSFRDTIVFITTNAGQSLYDDPTVLDLSNVPRHVITNALRTDIKPGTMNEPFFPECITTRFANGHVILFNHLEPFALMQIVQDEIRKQVSFFEKAYKISVKYDPIMLSAMVLYSAGGAADARSLRGTAKNMVVKELHDAILQLYHKNGDRINALEEIEICVLPERCDMSVQNLFKRQEKMHVLAFVDARNENRVRELLPDADAEYEVFSDVEAFKRRSRGVVDYILLDPTAGIRPMDRLPNDLEDYDAEGNDVFRYLREFFPEIPVYLLNIGNRNDMDFSTLLAKGGRDVIRFNTQDPVGLAEQLSALAFGALVNNSTFELGRSGKMLTYNCSQFFVDDRHVVIAFDHLTVGYAASSNDTGIITHFDDKNGVTFSDIVGCEEAKRALGDFCKFVSDPRRLIMAGKKIPKGVLLYGPPGTGKTMLAKAMANEAKAAFVPTTATSLFGSLVGESERNVRELFRRARRYAPAIIFIDEVDAIARARTGSVSTSHNEDTLNAFIAEMDGFSTDEKRPVFILAATNYDVSGDGPRVLDAAFVRRFDRKILIGLPDTEDRFTLLKLLLKKHSVDFGKDHDMIVRNLAERSAGMSNADLNIVIDMFLRNAEDKEPTSAALMDALDAFRFGEVNEYDPDDLRQTACHESGHALVARLLGETPSFLTVVARKNFGGFMEHAHDEKKMTSSFGELMNRVCTSLAGRAAEIEVYGKDSGMNTGASSDLANARFLIKVALNEYAMGDKLYTPSTDEECEKLMQTQFDRARALLAANRPVLDKLTDLLYTRKSLDKTELEAFFRSNL